MYDLLQVPVLGPEEDAADIFAAYLMLQFEHDQGHKLIIGAANAYDQYLRALPSRCRSRLFPAPTARRRSAFTISSVWPTGPMRAGRCSATSSSMGIFRPIALAVARASLQAVVCVSPTHPSPHRQGIGKAGARRAVAEAGSGRGTEELSHSHRAGSLACGTGLRHWLQVLAPSPALQCESACSARVADRPSADRTRRWSRTVTS